MSYVMLCCADEVEVLRRLKDHRVFILILKTTSFSFRTYETHGRAWRRKQ